MTKSYESPEGEKYALPESPSDEQVEIVDPIRAAVDINLTGIQAVREGSMDTFFILGPQDREPLIVTAENADEIEAKLRQAFSGRYPELISESHSGSVTTIDVTGLEAVDWSVVRMDEGSLE